MARPSKRKTLREILKAKKWAQDCPVCMTEMDYVELSKIEKLWAPSEYAWECVKCPNKVRVLDGHIDPQKSCVLIERCRERDSADFFTSIGIIAFGQKRRHKEPEVIPKKRWPEDAGVTASTGPA